MIVFQALLIATVYSGLVRSDGVPATPTGLPPQRGLDEEIAEGQNRISNASASSSKKLEACIEKLSDAVEYITLSSKKLQLEGLKKQNETLGMNDLNTRRYTGEKIDKVKSVSSFKCVLQTWYDTTKAVEASFAKAQKCLNDCVEKPVEEKNDYFNHFIFMRESTTGLYIQLEKDLKACNTSQCVQNAVSSAETRRNSLEKVLTQYEDRSIEIRKNFNDRSMTCVHNMQSEYDNELKNGENKLKRC